MQPNFLFSWPHAKVGVASPQHLLECGSTATETEMIKQESEYPTSILLHDGVILPSETRQVSLIIII